MLSVAGATFRAMAEVSMADLTGHEFHVFENVVFREVGFERVVMRGVDVVDLEIHGEIGRLVVNGVEVGPYVEAELDRRHPDRAAMRPTDAAGFRHAWDLVEAFWATTVDDARTLDEDLLHERVDGEFSFVQTLRHLSFATDCWVRRAVLGDPAPWDPLGLPWEGMPPTPGVPDDRGARPSLATVLDLRRDRMATVRAVVDGLTDAGVTALTTPVDGPGWPRAGAFEVGHCLRVVLNEEWQHHRFARRDLAVLTARVAAS